MIDGHAVIRANLLTEISKTDMSILGDAESYYVKNPGVNSVIISTFT